MVEGNSEHSTRRALFPRVLGLVAAAVILLIVRTLVFGYLNKYGYSDIWGGDGFTQHFPAYYHCREVLLAMWRDPAHAFTMWSFNIGLGADTIGTLSYYVGDPFALAGLLRPAGSLEYVYQAMFLSRLLAAGLAAYLYFRTMSAKTIGAIAGSLIYVFTTYTMFSALRHPYFANPLVWFPLILLGIELALRGRRPYVLVLAVLCAALSSFYFFYQISIIAIVYAVGRYFEVTPKGRRLRRLVPAAVWLAALYALGTACAAIVLWPALDAFFTSSRAGTAMSLGRFFDIDVYRSFIAGLTSPLLSAKSAFTGYSILGFIVLPALFMRRRNTTLKLLLLLFPASLVFPVIGAAFNGFAFPSYRFLFMWGLFLGAAVATVLSEDRAVSGLEIRAMLIGLIAYSTAVLIALGVVEIRVLLPLAIGTAMWVVFAIDSRVARLRALPQSTSGGADAESDAEGSADDAEGDPVAAAPAPAPRGKSSTLLRLVILGLLVYNIAALGLFAFDTRFSDRLADYMPLGKTLTTYREDVGTDLRKLPGASAARIDKQNAALGTSDLKMTSSNDALVQGYLGISSYYSVIDAGVHAYLNGLDVRSQRDAFDYNGFDDRAALEALNGVRYYMAGDRGSQYVPYGFTPSSTLNTSTVYENAHPLPLGYVYHSMIPSDTYAALSPLDKQQALLQGVVLGGDAGIDLPRAQLTSEVVSVPFSTWTTGTTTIDESARTLATTTDNGQVNLRFSPVADSELYVDMTGISFTLTTSSVEPTAVARSESVVTELSEPPDPGDFVAADPVHIAIGTHGPSKTERQESPLYEYSWGDTSVLTNLGYFAQGTDGAYVRLVEPATVNYADLRVYAVPMARFNERIAALAADGMRDVVLSQNRVRGSVTSHGAGLLFLSVPYSRGWSAKVDGRPARIVRANVGFIGIPLSDGSHTVQLDYVTPVLPTALQVSGMGLALFALLVVGWEIAALVRAVRGWLRARREARERAAHDEAAAQEEPVAEAELAAETEPESPPPAEEPPAPGSSD